MANPRYRIETLGRRALCIGIWNEEAGGGLPPLLICNGLGMNMGVLAPLAARLSDRMVISFDPPGVGHSPDPWLPYTPWNVANWIAALLDRLGIGKADVLGFSWGGAIAQQFALQHKRRINRLALAAIGPGWPMIPGQPSTLSFLTDPDWVRQLRADPRRLAFLGIGEADRRALTGSFLKRLKLPRTRGYVFQMGALAGWSSALTLPLLDRPVLVLMGSEDQVVPVANGRLLCALIPGAHLQVIGGGGHLFMFSHAAECVRHLRGFLGSDKQGVRRAG